MNRVLPADRSRRGNPVDVGFARAALREREIVCGLRVISHGEEALSFIDRLDLDSIFPGRDLLLLDLYLPKHSGSEILKAFSSK